MEPNPNAIKDFPQQVYEIVQLIPKGRVTTYGAIAKALGAARSSRMVGICLINAHHSISHLPIYRVVNRNGMLTGKHHYGSPTRMQELLENEGITIENDKVKDFKKLFWNPLTELLY